MGKFKELDATSYTSKPQNPEFTRPTYIGLLEILRNLTLTMDQQNEEATSRKDYEVSEGFELADSRQLHLSGF